jgi:1-phosphofructokinase family hexose kinase
MIITVTLNPAVDLSLVVPEWATDSVNRATAVCKFVGGKGINISRVLTELGDPTTALTVVGSDSVQQFQRLARLTGTPIVYINVPGEIRTNIHITDPTDGRHLKVNQSGPPLDDLYFNHFKLLYRQHLRGARMVGIGGSLPPGRQDESYAELIALAAERRIPVLLDTVGDPLRAALEQKPWIVKPNRLELGKTVGAELDTEADVLDAARELQSDGARGVVVTDGPNPVIGVFEKVAYKVTPPRIEINGPTGAGDALAAGLLSGFLKGDAFCDALRLGVAVSAAACLTPEGELVRKSDVTKLLRQVDVEEL